MNFEIGAADLDPMDVRNVLGSLIPTNITKKDPTDKIIKSDSTTERDGNGQMPFGDGQDQKPPMSEEQLKKAVEHLASHAAVKENNLSVELVKIDGKNFVLIKEPSGKIVRRIPEIDLWTLKDVQENEKGQLLRRTA